MKLMKFRSYILIVLLILPFDASAQLFHPLDLGFNGGERQGNFSQPRMHVESDRLFVCTNQGLYAKDLSADNSAWQLVGFEGVPLQDYARRGSDILALRSNEGGSFLLLSHDGGQTYEDVTPGIPSKKEYERFFSLASHPTDQNTLMVSSNGQGILLSTDFGQTWECLTEFVYGNPAATFIGFHPARPNIIYNSGEGIIFEGHIKISYDGGQTWNDHGNSLGFPGDNCVHQPTFHPTNPDRWLAGGEGCVFLSDDNGQTWSCQNYWGDETRMAYWIFSAFDNEHPDTVYMAGCLGRNGQKDACIKLMCSTDGGHSWHPSQVMTSKREHDRINDLQQYGNRLVIYSESGVYEVSKAELVAKSTTDIRSVASDQKESPIYDLQGRKVVEPHHGIYIKNGRIILK
ncbi:WD40/YVTN/BNR-like repeat-containing protein [Prevotella sp. E13-27]|uniref:WD40/YVTN/BNR-like repeat-containing protein n=1 Tax=Prevotella sp. E13-27 TaxID=2938122 RepID=UPI00200A21D9|nr:sialidase family protein [Prevotella sp. E13-27]MCK8623745.1 hypothetical protein [Prevotella sp. E13-27]